MGDVSIAFIEGERKGERVPLTGPLLMGRSSKAGLLFSAPEVSGRHLQVEWRGKELVLTQMGSGKTWLKGDVVAPGAERVLKPGDTVAFAGGNAFVLEMDDSDSDELATDPEGERTTAAAQTGPTVMASAAVAGPSRAAAPDDDDDVDDATSDGTDAGTRDAGTQDADDETQVMKTRAITEEEENRLRQSDKISARKRMCLVAGAAVFAVAVIGGAWLFSVTQIENPLTWPAGADGRPMYHDTFVDLDGAREKGEFGFFAPGSDALKVDEQMAYIRVTTRLGRRQDVPCRITLERGQAAEHLEQSREQGFARWRERKMAEGGSWSFEVEPGIFFVGAENGVPYQRAAYSREEGGVSWFGYAQYMKVRDWEIVLLKELPTSERYRGDYLLAGTTFFLARPSFVEAHWEPDGVVPNRSEDDMLKEVEKWLAPDETPGQQLKRVQELVVRALTLACKKKNAENYKRAMALLLELRRRQNVELNNRLIAIRRERATGRDKVAAALTKQCLDVFSDENDKRCHDLRRGIGLRE